MRISCPSILSPGAAGGGCGKNTFRFLGRRRQVGFHGRGIEKVMSDWRFVVESTQCRLDPGDQMLPMGDERSSSVEGEDQRRQRSAGQNSIEHIFAARRRAFGAGQAWNAHLGCGCGAFDGPGSRRFPRGHFGGEQGLAIVFLVRRERATSDHPGLPGTGQRAKIRLERTGQIQ